jgi:phage antirepressor YoqD-like protein/predicted transcriptional regulator
MQNTLVPVNNTMPMSSKEIAEIVESRPDTVKVAMERLAKNGVITFTSTTEKSEGGRPGVVYRVGKRDSYVVVAQLCPEFTARLVDRWQELEAQVAAPTHAIPQTFSQALMLAAQQAERIELQEAVIEQQKPAVEFVDRYVSSTGNRGFREVCKLLGANEAEFRLFLLDEEIMYRLGGVLTPHARHLDAGRFVVKAGASDAGHAFNQAKFTPKGIQWIAGLWVTRKAAA